jgi:hypothetical protein
VTSRSVGRDATVDRSGPAGLGALTGGSRIGILTAPLVVGTLAAGSLSVGTATAVITVPSIAGFVVAMVLLRRSASRT